MVLCTTKCWIRNRMSYEYSTAHQVLRRLPTKLAEWISTNLSDELWIPDKNKDKWNSS
jgi:hypothetical protein